jgi:hypothetical protein
MITAKRAQVIGAWAKGITDPMHVVLTQKNFKDLDWAKISEHTDNLRRIRKREPFLRARGSYRTAHARERVRGGCISVELTNSAVEGWHLHSHWLLDCQYLDMKELSKAWGELVGQEFAIVHYNNNKEKTYVQEVCKYVCKPSEMVNWSALEILSLIESARGRRFFFQFGSLLDQGQSIRTYIQQTQQRPPCTCRQCQSEALQFRVSSSATDYHKQRARQFVDSFA